MSITNTLEIDAPAERVWALTIDVERWPSTTPTITKVERLDRGPLRVGSSARVKQPMQGTRVWTVGRLEDGRLFEWSTKVPGAVMTGRHRIEPIDAGRCRNVLELDVTGPLAGVVRALVRRPIAKAIATENQGFKRAAEAATA